MKQIFVLLLLAVSPLVLAHSGHGMEAGAWHEFLHAYEMLGVGVAALVVVLFIRKVLRR